MASSSAAVAGRRSATAFSVSSLKTPEGGRAGRSSARAFQRLVAEDPEGGKSAAFRLRQTPLAQFPFDERIGRKLGTVRRARRRWWEHGRRLPRAFPFGGRPRFLLPALARFGGRLRGVLHEQIARHNFFQRLAIRRETRLAVWNGLAVLFKDGVRQPEEIGARHGAQDLLESVARHFPVRAHFGVQFAGRSSAIP